MIGKDRVSTTSGLKATSGYFDAPAGDKRAMSLLYLSA
jgi:hypothetical protein